MALAAVAAVLPALVVLLSPVHVDAPAPSAALETTIAILGLASAGLVARRLASTRLRRDLLLLAAVVSASLTELAFASAPAIAGVDRAVAGVDARVLMQLIVALVFAAAALARDEAVAGSTRRVVAGSTRRVVAVAVVAGGVVVGCAELADSLLGVQPLIGTLNDAQAAAAGHAAFALAAVAVSSAVLAAAAVALVARTAARDRSAGLLAAALFLLAASGLEFFTLPAAPAGWVTPGDLLRLIAYAMLLLSVLESHVRARRDTAGSERLELLGAIERATQLAASAERRRLARDLHDGLAQDLAIIALYAQQLESELGPDHPLMVAARHALATSRGAILDLSDSPAPTTKMARRTSLNEADSEAASVQECASPVPGASE